MDNITEGTDEQLPHSAPAVAYVPPLMVRLGTLAELTQGGTDTLNDGDNGAGDEGSL